MQGIVQQINISHGGIPKLPIPEAKVTRKGITGDSWAHPRFHGGPKQALLLISIEDIRSLKGEGFSVYPGALGENLTTSGIDMRQVRFGDQFLVGEAVLEITKLRQPCRTLNAIGKGLQFQLYDVVAGSEKWGRGGFYAKVLQGGTVKAGDIISRANQEAV